MSNTLTILVSMSAASVFSLVIGLIGAQYTKRQEISYFEGIPFVVNAHRGGPIAAAVGFAAVVAVAAASDLRLLTMLIPAVLTGAIGFWGTTALVNLFKSER